MCPSNTSPGIKELNTAWTNTLILLPTLENADCMILSALNVANDGSTVVCVILNYVFFFNYIFQLEKYY